MNDLSPPSHDAGGKVRIAMPDGWTVKAEFSGPNDCYRTSLMHRWAPGPLIFWCLMNPSTADHRFLDPTVAKTARLAKRLGYGSQFIGNVCAYRSTDKRRLLEIADPTGGKANVHEIMRMARLSELIVVAHGILPGDLQKYADATCALLRGAGHKLHVLKLTKNGVPSHPLYIPESTVPQLWSGPATTEQAA